MVLLRLKEFNWFVHAVFYKFVLYFRLPPFELNAFDTTGPR